MTGGRVLLLQTEAQFHNHENSRKHRDKVAKALKKAAASRPRKAASDPKPPVDPSDVDLWDDGGIDMLDDGEDLRVGSDHGENDDADSLLDMDDLVGEMDAAALASDNESQGSGVGSQREGSGGAGAGRGVPERPYAKTTTALPSRPLGK